MCSWGSARRCSTARGCILGTLGPRRRRRVRDPLVSPSRPDYRPPAPVGHGHCPPPEHRGRPDRRRAGRDAGGDAEGPDPSRRPRHHVLAGHGPHLPVLPVPRVHADRPALPTTPGSGPNVRPDGGWSAFQATATSSARGRRAAPGCSTHHPGREVLQHLRALTSRPATPDGLGRVLAFTTRRVRRLLRLPLGDGSVQVHAGRLLTDVLALAATDLIQQARRPTQPLFLWFAPYAPHAPFDPAPRHRHATVDPARRGPGSRTSRPSRAGCRHSTRPSAGKVPRTARRQQRALMARRRGGRRHRGRPGRHRPAVGHPDRVRVGQRPALGRAPACSTRTSRTRRPPRCHRCSAGTGTSAPGRWTTGWRLNIDITATLAAAGLTGMHTDGSDLLTPAATRRVRARGCRRPAAAATAVLRLAGGRLDLRALLDRRGGALLRSPTTPTRCTTWPRVPMARDQLDAMRAAGPRGLHAGAAGLRLVSRQSRSTCAVTAAPRPRPRTARCRAGSVNHAIVVTPR